MITRLNKALNNSIQFFLRDHMNGMLLWNTHRAVLVIEPEHSLTLDTFDWETLTLKMDAPLHAQVMILRPEQFFWSFYSKGHLLLLFLDAAAYQNIAQGQENKSLYAPKSL